MMIKKTKNSESQTKRSERNSTFFQKSRFKSLSYYNSWSLALLIMASMFLGIVFPVRAGTTSQLNAKTKTRVKRFLFPLPQKYSFGSKMFSYPANRCVLVVGSKINEQEQQFVIDFRVRWKRRFGIDLQASSIKEPLLRIVVGLNEKKSPLTNVALKKHLNLKYLANRPNSEQAYAITCTKTAVGATVYLAANASPGFYYALGTFEQLVSALSKPGIVTVPEVQLVDWPDVCIRSINGLWWSGANNPPFMIKELATMSYQKLNACELSLLSLSKFQVKDNGTIWFNPTKEIHQGARRFNMRLLPMIPHLHALLAKSWANFDSIADQITADKGVKTHGKSWCWHKPRSQEVLFEMMSAVAKERFDDILSVYLSEGLGGINGACACPYCKGDSKANFINETKNIIKAYRKLKPKYPSLKLNIVTTQGSYPWQKEIFKIIPSDVGITFYAGSGPGLTYQTNYGSLLDGYPAKTLSAKGHSLGAIPLLIAAWDPAMAPFPFDPPSLAKERMSEMTAKHISLVNAYMPFDVWMNDMSVEALAEYSWNTKGRDINEFAVSWAVRKGYANPESIARIVSLLDKPSRMLSIGIVGNKFGYGLPRMVKQILGIKPKWGNYFNLLKGLEKDKNSKHAETLVHQCDKAFSIAQSLGDKRFIAEAALTRQWMRIFLEYALFLESKRGAIAKQDAKTKIARLGAKLPQLWLDWIVTQPIRAKRKKSFVGGMDEVMKEFRLLGKMPHVSVLAKDWVMRKRSDK